MAGDWLPVRLDLHDDLSVISIANDLGQDEYWVVGRLIRLWSWANRETEDGNAHSVTETWIDRYIGATGFARAMQKAGWLDLSKGHVIFPKFDRWNSQGAKRRILTAIRVDRHRAKNCNAASVTKTLPEKRREELKTPPDPPLPRTARGGTRSSSREGTRAERKAKAEKAAAEKRERERAAMWPFLKKQQEANLRAGLQPFPVELFDPNNPPPGVQDASASS